MLIQLLTQLPPLGCICTKLVFLNNQVPFYRCPWWRAGAFPKVCPRVRSSHSKNSRLRLGTFGVSYPERTGTNNAVHVIGDLLPMETSSLTTFRVAWSLTQHNAVLTRTTRIS